jgi:hypothetical protein
MSETFIYINYNQGNPKATAFASQFGKDLTKCLARLGCNASVLADPKVDLAHSFTVLSYQDVNSQWLPEHNLKSTGIFIDPIPSESSYTSMFEKNHLFWEKVFETSEILLLREDEPKTRLEYWSKITDIAIGMAEQSKQVKTSTKGIVYLSYDDTFQASERENILRDLNDIGFEVVPNSSLPKSFDDCTKQIDRDLQKAELIIHIIPPVYIPFFINQHLSVAEHQCNVSACFVKGKQDISRLLWIPSTYEVTDEESLVFIEKIQRDHDQTDSSTVLKSTVEDLKKHYRSLLLNSNELSVKSKGDELAYILSDDLNNGMLNEVGGVFKQLSIDFETNINGMTYNQHLRKLSSAKIVIVCYSTQNQGWLSVKVSDILKSKGLDTHRQFEKVILISESGKLTEIPHNSVFTHILEGVQELSSIICDTSMVKHS